MEHSFQIRLHAERKVSEYNKRTGLPIIIEVHVKLFEKAVKAEIEILIKFKHTYPLS